MPDDAAREETIAVSSPVVLRQRIVRPARTRSKEPVSVALSALLITSFYASFAQVKAEQNVDIDVPIEELQEVTVRVPVQKLSLFSPVAVSAVPC